MTSEPIPKIYSMFLITTSCSSATCLAEDDFVVASVEEADALTCECGYCVVTLSIASFEPVYGKPALRLLTAAPDESDRLLAA